MNPLERALARRRVLGARLSIVALVLLVGSSGVVVPSLDGQRRARTQLLNELDSYESTLQLVADLRAYERSGVQVLDRAREELATYVPPPSSRAEVRAMLADQVHRAGIEKASIEVSATEPFGTEASIEDGVEDDPAALLSTTAIVSGTADFDQLVRFLHLLSNPRPLILVRQASFEREDGEPAGGELNFSVRLALVESPPQEVAPSDAVNAEPKDER